MGVSNGGTRRSTAADHGSVSSDLEPEDFDDVFGGPPRSLLARKLSADFTGNEWFYRQIFQPPEIEIPASVAGRRLPEFVIPVERDSDERPWLKSRPCKKGMVKRISRSKSTSSSVLSFEDEDVALSSFTSKLRPINVPSRWRSSSKHKNQDLPAFGCPPTNNHLPRNNEQSNDYMIRSCNYNYGFPQRVTSPETINPLINPTIHDYDMQLNSPSSSAISSLYHGPTTEFNHNNDQQREIDAEATHDEEVTSSYVLQMNSQTTQVNNSEAIDINEAIAWAKEKFRGWRLDGGEMQGDYQLNDG